MTDKYDSLHDPSCEVDPNSLAYPSADHVASAAIAPNGTSLTNRAPSSSTTSENGFAPAAKSSSAARSLNVSNSPSTASPFSSRDSSPSRPNPKLSQMPVQLPKRSRQHSKDGSPSRPPGLSGVGGTVPSAAAIQRALSSATTPQLQPTTGTDVKAPRPLRLPLGGSSGDATTLHWPVSPRLKSPPPTTTGTRSRKNSLSSLRSQALQSNSQTPRASLIPSGSAPNIVVQSSTPPPPPPPPPPSTAASSSSSVQRMQPKHEVNNSDSEDQAPLTMKLAGRGVGGVMPTTLETVQEGSVPATPSHEMTESQNFRLLQPIVRAVANELSDAGVAKVSEDLTLKNKSSESGSDSSGNKSDGKRISQQRSSSSATTGTDTLTSRGSQATLGTIKSRVEPPATRNMTVETETVPSIPQATIGTQPDRSTQVRAEASGSLRMKPSSETIRPKKERRKQQRKPPSINSGTASSKADIFEIKVANAVDEEDSSDSDETFVYESNPPEPQTRSTRHHSRTPSATSMTSVGDSGRTMRSIGNVLETHRSVPSKRSMKFANNTYNGVSPDLEISERGEGTLRLMNGRTSGGSSIHHHHIGRYGRNGGTHPSLFDSDSPFHPSAKPRVASSRQSSRPNSPRYPTFSARGGNGANKEHGSLSMYDLEGEGADDERTPLIGTVRGPRNRGPRRPNSASLRHYEHYQRSRGSWLRRFAGCMVMTVMILLLVSGAVGFLFATTKPLYGVEVREIQNVLASEEEIMLDLFVEAINPNVIAVSITDMDVNVFAKSKYVGTDKWWRDHGGDTDNSPWLSPRAKERTRDRRSAPGYEQLMTSKPTSSLVKIAGNRDEGTDPIDDDDPANDSQTMLLGRIFHFDSALVFEGSALTKQPHFDVGEVRLSKPGNKTEAGGTERWERVIMHPFELIVRGVLKYELPLSSTVHTAPIGASVVVRPSKGVDDGEQTPENDIDDGKIIDSDDTTKENKKAVKS